MDELGKVTMGVYLVMKDERLTWSIACLLSLFMVNIYCRLAIKYSHHCLPVMFYRTFSCLSNL